MSLKRAAVSLVRNSAFGSLCLAAGCAEFHAQPVRIGSTNAIVTRADLRIVTERPDLRAPGRNLVCAEPSPDVALAASQAVDVQAKTHGVGAGVGYGASEAVLALAGRTSSVVALRDGLFRACEAYSNGIIGRAEYAMILSQYGDLLVSLVLGGAAEASVQGSVSAPTVNHSPQIDYPPQVGGTSTGSGTTAGTSAGTSTGTSTSPTTGSPSASLTSDSGSASVLEAERITTTASADQPPPVLQPAVFWSRPSSDTIGITSTQATPAAGATPTTTAAETKPTATAVAPTPTAQSASGATASSAGTPPPLGGVASVAQLYFDSAAERFTKAVFVMCVSEAAEGRDNGRTTPQPADFISSMCDKETFMKLAAATYQGGTGVVATQKPQQVQDGSAQRRDATATTSPGDGALTHDASVRRPARTTKPRTAAGR